MPTFWTVPVRISVAHDCAARVPTLQLVPSNDPWLTL